MFSKINQKKFLSNAVKKKGLETQHLMHCTAFTVSATIIKSKNWETSENTGFLMDMEEGCGGRVRERGGKAL